ncbi:hypothetical protein L1887_55317 [Cichorium endivia]|nr:hypothetical protein L1887_55317 [Cichorium endivia]
MAANRSLSHAVRPLAHTPSASTSKQALLRATRPAHARAASTAVAAAAPATEAAAVSSTSYVHDPTPNAHLPRLARAEPELFAAVRPPPLSAFAALTARLGLLPSSLDAESRERRIRLVHQACTHPSFQALVDKINAAANLQLEPSAAASGLAKKRGATALDAAQFLPLPSGAVDHHAALATVGNSLLGMLATEHPASALPQPAHTRAQGGRFGRTPLGDFDLPSVTLDASFPGLTPSAAQASYNPQPLGQAEVLPAAGKNH